jgi:hypothetical protein
MLILMCAALVCLGSACRPEQDDSSSDDPQSTAQKAPELLVFPTELYVEDASVNAFVERAMADCASGDYETFRLLWSAREEPLPRDEYEQGWQVVQKIEIRALENVVLGVSQAQGREEPENAYVVLADVALDPAHPAGEREPNREVAMMLVQEAGEWRLGRVPEVVRTWVKSYGRRVDPAPQQPAGQAGD